MGGVLSARTAAVVDAYLSGLGVELHAEAPIFRNRSGQQYLKNAFAEDFREVRTATFGHLERRQYSTSAVLAPEAIVGDASPEHLAHAMGNTLSSSNAMFETYVPVQMATVSQVSDARRKGRHRLRQENGR